jgi:hypothetical protein
MKFSLVNFVLSQVSSSNARPVNNDLTDGFKRYKNVMLINDYDGVVGNDPASQHMTLEMLVTVLHFALCDGQRSLSRPVVVEQPQPRNVPCGKAIKLFYQAVIEVFSTAEGISS